MIHTHLQTIHGHLNGEGILHRGLHAHQDHLQGQQDQEHTQGHHHVLHIAIRDLDQDQEVVPEVDPDHEVNHEVEVGREVAVVDHILPLVAVRIVREVVHTVRDHLMIQDRDRDHGHVILDRDLDDIDRGLFMNLCLYLILARLRALSPCRHFVFW